MKKIVLGFPSRELMAEFMIACRIKGDFDPVNFTITGEFDQECIRIATEKYQGSIAASPDFILPHN